MATNMREFWKTIAEAPGKAPLSGPTAPTDLDAKLKVLESPGNLIATPGNARADLIWTKVKGATSYNIYRSDTQGGQPIKTVTGNLYTDTGLTNGTTYSYHVTAVSAEGESPSSNEASVIPQADSQTGGGGQAPADAVREIKELTELVKVTSDAARRDPIVSKLRDVFAKIVPFVPEKDAKKAINDAIESLVKTGRDAAIKKILEAVTGKSATNMPDDKNRNRIGPVDPKDPDGQRIFKTPEIPIPDVPKRKPRHRFDYKGVQKSYVRGADMKFTVIPPDAEGALQGLTRLRLMIVTEAERDKPNPAERFAEVSIGSGSPQAVAVKAPPRPGNYLIQVVVGLQVDYTSIQEFEVVPPPWAELETACDKYLTAHRFKAVKGEGIVPGDMVCDMYLDDQLLELRATTGSGQARVREQLLAAFPDLEHYPVQLAQLVGKRWDVEVAKALKAAGG
jgi:hypothetical protein